MANGQTLRLSSLAARAQAKRLIEAAPHGAVVNIQEARRTNEQNDKMWAMLSEISRAKPEGRTLSTDRWKALFMSAAGMKCDWEPGLDGDGVVPVGYRSSRLTKDEMSNVIEQIYEYGTRHGVVFQD